MDVTTVQAKFAALAPMLTERTRRVWAATEARALGHGGIALVERATGVSRATIQRGLHELDAQPEARLAPERSRRAGGGRKAASAADAWLLADLEALVEPTALGDPDSPLRWTTKSVRTLAKALCAMGHAASHTLVAHLLHDLGFSLQANRKTREGSSHPDRDAQFRYIAAQVRRCHQRGQPAISVDTKKKELVGEFKNPGRAWRPAGQPAAVRVHDFVIPAQAKAIPYGVYDLQRNEGWVSVGIDHDTARFAVNAIRRWWRVMGRPVYAGAGSFTHHGRCRRQQRRAPAPVEVGAAAVCQPHGPVDHGVSLPARHQQMEQDRAPAVLSHRDELARHAAGEPGGDCEPDRCHAQRGGPAGALRAGSWPLPGWHTGHRCPDGADRHRAASLPRRLELHDPSEVPPAK